MTRISEKLSAALAGRYRIVRRLGEGGMATVYLAEDVKHDRKVALKVLKPELAAVLGAERFVQEIKTTASLQHPHILPLFDSGEAEGFLFYVMPFIDGETLRDKLNRETQLGIEEAVRIATEVADALDYAHRNGVIHRDIKPENILLHDGRPTVADFGIALAVSAAAGGRMTETGLSLGTPHYMSPEQATAEKDLTARTDIYSLGSVLYEMLTGDPPHVGSSAQQIIMKIVTEEARPVTEVRKSVPPHVAAATAMSLEKLAADRFETAAKFGEALSDPSFTLPGTVSTTGTEYAASLAALAKWKRLAVAMTAASVLLLVALVWSLRPRQAVTSTYDVGLPAANPMTFRFGRSFSVSSSADFVVYNSVADSMPVLSYRSLRGEESRPIRGSEGSIVTPLISPDGRQVAYVAATETRPQLRIVPVDGGESRVVAEVGAPDAVGWLSDDEILVMTDDGRSLTWVDPAGGQLRSVATRYCINPSPAGDSGRYLCGGGGSRYGRVIDPADSTFSRLLRYRADLDDEASGTPVRGTDFDLVDSDYLVYLSLEGDLRATSIDLETFRVGRSVTLVSGVHYDSYSGAGEFAITRDGTLIYASGPPSNVGQLVQADRAGEIRALPFPTAAFLRWDLRPDGRRLAAAVEGIDGQELRVYDVETGRWRTWLEGAFVGHPRWSPDGRRILVSILPSPETSAAALVLGSPTASAPPDTIAAIALSIGSYFADSLIIADHGGGGPGAGVRIDLRTTPVTVDTIADLLFAPSLSPDGRWLAYVDRTGLVIEPWPDRGQRYTRLDNGDPQWISPTEVATWDLDGIWYRLRVDETADPPVGEPEFWFEDSRFSDTPGASHKATPDGGVIYMRGPDQRVAHYLRVVPGWVEQMKRAVDEANR